MLALGEYFFLLYCLNVVSFFAAVLHPYYKLAYIGLVWGGPEEQAKEIEDGNPWAKDWQDEARQLVEKTVSLCILFQRCVG